ncbi:unnamed protein product [Prorocentrum cordatum]|uniref:Sulfotransferase n=1 Tax=Prorocentrum cordatum TaxID=2364126 RepID=A0ABN9VDI8_9DINO|nr:unnamed protein product [Polarella glacialis]
MLGRSVPAQAVAEAGGQGRGGEGAAAAAPAACEAGAARAASPRGESGGAPPAVPRDLFADPGPFLFYLKTPKTGGESFSKDIWLKAVHPLGKELVRPEGCYSWHRNFSNCTPGSVVTLARNPREHVMSQYWHCKSSKMAQKPHLKDIISRLPSFEEWVGNWTLIRANCSHYGDFAPGNHGFAHVSHFGTNTPYKCYNPINMQSHRFTCRKSFEFPDRVNLSLALHNMWAAWFVGVLELYQESVCLFLARILNFTTPLPAGCNASDEAAWHKFTGKLSHDTHGVNHSHRTIHEEPEDFLRAVDSLVAEDLVLYSAAKRRLLAELDEVERVRGVKILSESRRQLLLE